ncbi:uncharacterized protein LOC131658206 [Vicia villosa]|uniref:uncharacterized protein LOC131658206 n=1 Tax=Vicia villosa TaxID=3911 RepID=UPI00273B2FEF|nr:uncharacterized protein LOC131658206 [Vicia villosa]
MAVARRDFIAEITPTKESWDVVVRGGKIQASVRKALLYQFDNKVREGNVYNFKHFGVAANTGAYRTTKHQFKLSLQNSTVVTEFVSFAEIVRKIDMNYLIDNYHLILNLCFHQTMYYEF